MLKNNALIIGLILAVTVHAYDELVLAIAMPTITEELDGFALYGLAFAAYLLSTLIGVVWAGQDTDRRGPLRIFLIGYSAFAVGLLIAGFADSMLMLIIGRVLQGLGGGISWTVAFAVINLAYEPLQRPKMIAILDIAWVVPSLVAPIIGGYFVDYIGWRWIFFSQLPLLVFASLLLYPRLRKLNKHEHVDAGNRLGAAFVLACACGLALYLGNQQLSWWWVLLLPVLLLMRRALRSLLPTGFGRRDNALSIALLVHAGVFICFYGYEIFLPIATTELYAMDAMSTGLLIGFGVCLWCIASFLQARLSRLFSARKSLLLGFGSFSVGAAIMLSSPQSMLQNGSALYASMALCAFGMGIAFNTCVSTAMAVTESGQEGATSTALGIVSSLAVGLIAGLGGAILNVGERQSMPLSDTLNLIWWLTFAVALIVLTALAPYLRHSQVKKPKPA